jgi:hypothetical protein
MQPLQLLLTATALLTAVGGLVMLFRSARSDASPRQAYIPLATTAVGLIIAYRSISEFSSMDAVDLTIMFLFALGLLSFMGLQFFIVDRSKHIRDTPERNNADRNPPRTS